jgi:hypothetical protein
MLLSGYSLPQLRSREIFHVNILYSTTRQICVSCLWEECYGFLKVGPLNNHLIIIVYIWNDIVSFEYE